jgi:2-polyprenyl-3-methyl-5-hydroxy-6-metoxy-1,4-benzoquinol methylase
MAMDAAYFQHTRYDIEPLLPAVATHILDIGAGAGLTSAWLKSRFPASRTVAIEGNPAMLTELSGNVDEAFIVDLNGPIPDMGSPDLILCLDVLEHLIQPEHVLAHLTASLAAGGTVIVSLPNIAHLSVSLPLLLGGKFEYRDAGILDRTHLRFFVRDSVIALMNRAGLTVKRGIRGGMRGPLTRVADAITAGMLRDRLTKQYIVAGKSAPGSVEQGAIEWIVA